MKILLIILVVIGSIGSLIGLSYGFGWIGVHQKKTIGKAMQNAERTVFEESQSFVEGKRQEAGRLYREYKGANETDQKAICAMVGHTFANFNIDYLNPPISDFVRRCVY